MIRIITDTAADITLEQAARLDIELVSLRVSFGDAPYEQLADDEHFSDFYRRLAQAKDLPATSQPAPADFLVHYARAKKSGDDVLVICLSGALSGTWQSACLAAGMADYDRIWVVDSRQAIMGQRLLVEYAVRLRDTGRTAGEIYAIITEAAGRVILFGALDTLKYLRKGGRIPKGAEMLGTMMGIKPLVALEGGVITMKGKARGHAGVFTGLVRLMEQSADFDPVAPVYFGYTFDEQQGGNFSKLAAAKFKLRDTRLCPVGGLIGAHVGPGCVAAAWLAKAKPGGANGK